MSQPDLSRGLSSVLTDDSDRIIDEWSELVAGSLRGRVTRADVRAELAEIYRSLRLGVEATGGLGLGPDSDTLSDLRVMLSELSRARAVQGFSPRETAVSVFALKDIIARRAAVLSKDDLISFNRLVDDLALLTFEAYAEAREQVIADQAAQLMELSTPVVKLWDGIIAVPLVGTLDSARAQAVMEQLLEALTSTNADYAIIDITGVPAVDTQVAQHLLKTVMAARLMGAEAIISGIRPQIAQTIVALGIEFGDIATKASLADALALALRRIEATTRTATTLGA